MIQHRQLSLFDVMPDAEINSLIEQLPCRVAKSRIRSAKPKLPYFHIAVTDDGAVMISNQDVIELADPANWTTEVMAKFGNAYTEIRRGTP